MMLLSPGTPSECIAYLNAEGDAFDEWLQRGGYKQNRKKEEIIVSLDTRQHVHDLAKHGQLPCVLLHTLRHLGGWTTPACANTTDVEKRLQSMAIGWCAYSGAWGDPKIPKDFKRLLFLGVVYNASLS
eukprot:576445-Pyramimonas_sp.AAC.1